MTENTAPLPDIIPAYSIPASPKNQTAMFTWHVSSAGDIEIKRNIDYGSHVHSTTLTLIPSCALRFAVANATGQGDGVSRSGNIDRS